MNYNSIGIDEETDYPCIIKLMKIAIFNRVSDNVYRNLYALAIIALLILNLFA